MQYYHRNMATEIGGMIYGKYAGSVKDMEPGGLSFENSYMPHGGESRHPCRPLDSITGKIQVRDYCGS
jgi:homogentisate 1,2-dioxygenase